MSTAVTVVDYGIGNLYSVTRALEVSGASVRVTSSSEHIARAERLVLPGVGAFEDGMSGLRQRDQLGPLLTFVSTGRPFLGICVGMQLLFEVGEEFGDHAGLGLMAGRVRPIPPAKTDATPHRIPHIGWNTLVEPAPGKWGGTLLDGLTPSPTVYFVHSFAPEPENNADRLADCIYGGHRICAVVQSSNVSGCQFHPEKSGPTGLRILENFLRV